MKDTVRHLNIQTFARESAHLLIAGWIERIAYTLYADGLMPTSVWWHTCSARSFLFSLE
jgi:hypothetical protein